VISPLEWARKAWNDLADGSFLHQGCGKTFLAWQNFDGLHI